MILTYLHLSRLAECNSLALAVSQGISKCNELWHIRESKCLVKKAMHESMRNSHYNQCFPPLDSPALFTAPLSLTGPLLQPSKCATSGNTADKITRHALELRMTP